MHKNDRFMWAMRLVSQIDARYNKYSWYRGAKIVDRKNPKVVVYTTKDVFLDEFFLDVEVKVV